MFQSTIRDNITLGIPDGDSISNRRIHNACRSAKIHDFITSLPLGYATPLGHSGLSLSGGQKQRLSIARALIRNPHLLLLDEATSSLDSETEREVQEVFEQEAKGRTMIVVAHRLATVQNADVIFVVSEGRVVESGDHVSLARKRGVYWEMVSVACLI